MVTDCKILETEPKYQQLHKALASHLKFEPTYLNFKKCQKFNCLYTKVFFLLLFLASVVKIIVGLDLMSVQETGASQMTQSISLFSF